MKLITTIVIYLILTSKVLIGQITIGPETLIYNSNDSVSEYIFDLDVQNKGSQTLVWWKINRDSLMPSNWELFMCDYNKCYGASLSQCPPSKPDTLKLNSTGKWTLHFNADTVGGLGNVWVELYSDKSFKTLITTTNPEGHIKIGDVKNSLYEPVNKFDINVFPNPVQQSFFIEKNNEISKLSLFDLMGKELKCYNYAPDKSYDISSLLGGIYFINFLDKKGKSIGTKMFSKL